MLELFRLLFMLRTEAVFVLAAGDKELQHACENYITCVSGPLAGDPGVIFGENTSEIRLQRYCKMTMSKPGGLLQTMWDPSPASAGPPLGRTTLELWSPLLCSLSCCLAKTHNLCRNHNQGQHHRAWEYRAWEYRAYLLNPRHMIAAHRSS